MDTASTPSSSPTDAEVAWLAGIFEGEGCVYVLRRGGQAERVVLAIAMTDLDVIERVQRIAGCGSISPERRREGRKDIYRWNTSARRDVPRVLEMMAPWLLSRRTARIAEAVAEVAASREGMAPRGDETACHRGHLRSVDSYRGPRGHWICRPCVRIHSKAAYAAKKANAAPSSRPPR